MEEAGKCSYVSSIVAVTPTFDPQQVSLRRQERGAVQEHAEGGACWEEGVPQIDN